MGRQIFSWLDRSLKWMLITKVLPICRINTASFIICAFKYVNYVFLYLQDINLESKSEAEFQGEIDKYQPPVSTYSLTWSRLKWSILVKLVIRPIYDIECKINFKENSGAAVTTDKCLKLSCPQKIGRQLKFQNPSLWSRVIGIFEYVESKSALFSGPTLFLKRL